MVLGGGAALVGLVNVSAVVGGVLGAGACFCGGGWALRGVQFLFFRSFLLVLKKISFWGEDWALVYNSMKLEILLLFPNFLGPKFSVTPQLGYTTFIINNQASLHLW